MTGLSKVYFLVTTTSLIFNDLDNFSMFLWLKSRFQKCPKMLFVQMLLSQKCAFLNTCFGKASQTVKNKHSKMKLCKNRIGRSPLYERSKTILMCSCVGGAGAGSPTSKIGRILVLVCQYSTKKSHRSQAEECLKLQDSRAHVRWDFLLKMTHLEQWVQEKLLHFKSRRVCPCPFHTVAH